MGKLTLVLAAAFIMGISILAVPETSHAVSITINNVTVTVGSVNGCISGCSNPTNNIWASAAGTVLTSPDVSGTHSLVLTQTAGFNFDTSDNNGLNCSSSAPCATTLSINGVVIPLSGPNATALANFNTDPGGAAHNEATDWGTKVFNGGPGGLSVWFGYADNAHTNPCADADGNCLPENPWQGSPNTLFVGATGGPTGCDRPGITACFDAGTIRIEVNPLAITPEPASMLLLGFGLIGLAGWVRKNRN